MYTDRRVAKSIVFNHQISVEARVMLIDSTLGRTTGIISGMILMVIPKPCVGIVVFPLTTIQYSMAMLVTPSVKLIILDTREK